MSGTDLLTSLALVLWVGAVLWHFNKRRVKMKKFLLFLVAALVLSAGTAQAAQTISLFDQGKDTMVGGLPLFYSFSATSEADDTDITITTPAGFVPDVVYVVEDYDTTPNVCIWFKGMAEPSAVYITAGTGIITYVTTGAIDPASGSILIGQACQANSGLLVGYAIRYAQ